MTFMAYLTTTTIIRQGQLPYLDCQVVSTRRETEDRILKALLAHSNVTDLTVGEAIAFAKALPITRGIADLHIAADALEKSLGEWTGDMIRGVMDSLRDGAPKSLGAYGKAMH